MLLHLGHLGSSSDNITYIRHLGHPTRTMEVVSELLTYLSCSDSDETQELGGEDDEEDDVEDRLGEFIVIVVVGFLRWFLDKSSFKSNLGFFPLFLLIVSLSVFFLSFLYSKKSVKCLYFCVFLCLSAKNTHKQNKTNQIIEEEEKKKKNRASPKEKKKNMKPSGIRVRGRSGEERCN